VPVGKAELAGVTVKILPARSTASAEISTSASSPP
jgi:hypothetical protein